jgi:hypothetical protein
MRFLVRAVLAPLLLAACSSTPPAGRRAADADLAADALEVMDAVAERYVRLVLAVGEHDEAYVDAYYGPADRREEVAMARPDLATIRAEAEAAIAELDASPVPAGAEELVRLRHAFLRRQLESLVAQVRIDSGETLRFDEESRLLYDAVAPHHDLAHFAPVLAELSALLPGEQPLPERYEAFRSRFYVPRERLQPVFDAAIAECRARTARHLELPAGESFTVEYVTGKPWSAYNWYQGGYRSLIQVNTDLPVAIDRAIDLACHEGYPGHHVYNALLEKHLVRDRGWVELQVYPLFSPMSLIAEGTANFGIEVAFPGEERVRWEREHLFPLAGLDGSQAELYYRVLALVRKLDYAGNEAARRFRDGEIDAAAAARMLHEVALTSPLARAEQRVRFFQTYGAYVINYNLGQDLVRAWVERQGGTPDNPARRWQVFAELLASPRLPAGLAAGRQDAGAGGR